jgi:glutamate-5-semialdehyde dehydrogenase
MLKQIGTQAKDAAAEIAVLSTDKKNQILQTMADELLKNSKKILDANKIDLNENQSI